jgi:hypothetical protein
VVIFNIALAFNNGFVPSVIRVTLVIPAGGSKVAFPAVVFMLNPGYDKV